MQPTAKKQYPRYLCHDVPTGSVIAGGWLRPEIDDGNAIIALPDGSGIFGTSLALVRTIATNLKGETLCLILRGKGYRDNGKGNKPSPVLIVVTYDFNPEKDEIPKEAEDILLRCFNALEYDKSTQKTALEAKKVRLPTCLEAVAAGWIINEEQLTLLQDTEEKPASTKGKVNAKTLL